MMNLQEQISRMQSMMGLLMEDEVKNQVNSYLDYQSGKKTEKPKLAPELEKFRKQFGNRPTTASTTKEIKFELDDEKGKLKRWRVIFPENFMNKNLDTDQYNVVDDEGNPLDVKVPLSQIFEFGSIYIYSEGELNRIHFTQMGEFNHMSGIPSELRGIGLGYLIYEEFIHFLGFASSASHASPEAVNIWKKLYKDPEFYGVVISIDDNKKGGILLFHQDYNGDVEDITVKFIKRRLYSIINEENNTNPIIIDDKLMKYPKVAEIYEDVSSMIKMPFQERIEYFNKKYPL
jgi:hypothetical protein